MGSPPPMTLPNVKRSGAQLSPAALLRPQYPASWTRKPVSTSSRIMSAPSACVMRRIAALKPSSGVTTPMLHGADSVITAAIWPGCSANAVSSAATSL